MNIIIASNGTSTVLFVNGKVYGDHMISINFRHDNRESDPVALNIESDVLEIDGDDSIEALVGIRGFIDRMMFEAAKCPKDGH